MSVTRNRVKTALRRRRDLSHRFDVKRAFEQLEETCVPSYLHGNPAAASVAWLRLMAAAALHDRHAPTGPILDFGAATGELYHLLGAPADYSFIEEDEFVASVLPEFAQDAIRETLDGAPDQKYAAVFALDSLEHNENVAELVDRLMKTLMPGGVFILSGPTENALYRLGRRIAGFDGHYHHTTIIDIERIVAERMVRVDRRVIPFGVPLFQVSAWRLKASDA